MAALRAGMAMLGRRSCGCSGSAASMGGKGMEIHQVFRPAPPPLRPVAVRNFEGCRRFSTGFEESADKAESGKPTWWWQRVKHRMDVDSNVRTRIHFVYTVFVLWTPTALFIHVLLEE